MKTPIIIAAVAFGTLFIGGVGSALYTANPNRPRCDSTSTVATMRGLALRKIVELTETSDDNIMRWLIKGDYHASSLIMQATTLYRDVEFGMSAFRERGKVGDGLLCAAMISLRAPGKPATALLSAEYSVEPTTDGKVMVTARFTPN